MRPVLNVSVILPPVALHVTRTSAVSPAAVRPTAVKGDFWFGLRASCRGETTTRVTSAAGPASWTGFSQPRTAAAETRSRASLRRAKRTESLCLKVMGALLPVDAAAGLSAGPGGQTAYA